ncbi:hypothetical protein BASA60_001203 [Batrachochytrium salamandrivorans]|nr:hypothetical protein BASA60_001203 [Batrachochytrium salamandrivorans]
MNASRNAHTFGSRYNPYVSIRSSEHSRSIGEVYVYSVASLADASTQAHIVHKIDTAKQAIQVANLTIAHEAGVPFNQSYKHQKMKLGRMNSPIMCSNFLQTTIGKTPANYKHLTNSAHSTTIRNAASVMHPAHHENCNPAVCHSKMESPLLSLEASANTYSPAEDLSPVYASATKECLSTTIVDPATEKGSFCQRTKPNLRNSLASSWSLSHIPLKSNSQTTGRQHATKSGWQSTLNLYSERTSSFLIGNAHSKNPVANLTAHRKFSSMTMIKSDKEMVFDSAAQSIRSVVSGSALVTHPASYPQQLSPESSASLLELSTSKFGIASFKTKRLSRSPLESIGALISIECRRRDFSTLREAVVVKDKAKSPVRVDIKSKLPKGGILQKKASSKYIAASSSHTDCTAANSPHRAKVYPTTSSTPGVVVAVDLGKSASIKSTPVSTQNTTTEKCPAINKKTIKPITQPKSNKKAKVHNSELVSKSSTKQDSKITKEKEVSLPTPTLKNTRPSSKKNDTGPIKACATSPEGTLYKAAISQNPSPVLKPPLLSSRAIQLKKINLKATPQQSVDTIILSSPINSVKSKSRLKLDPELRLKGASSRDIPVNASSQLNATMCRKPTPVKNAKVDKTHQPSTGIKKVNSTSASLGKVIREKKLVSEASAVPVKTLSQISAPKVRKKKGVGIPNASLDKLSMKKLYSKSLWKYHNRIAKKAKRSTLNLRMSQSLKQENDIVTESMGVFARLRKEGGIYLKSAFRRFVVFPLEAMKRFFSRIWTYSAFNIYLTRSISDMLPLVGKSSTTNKSIDLKVISLLERSPPIIQHSLAELLQNGALVQAKLALSRSSLSSIKFQDFEVYMIDNISDSNRFFHVIQPYLSSISTVGLDVESVTRMDNNPNPSLIQVAFSGDLVVIFQVYRMFLTDTSSSHLVVGANRLPKTLSDFLTSNSIQKTGVGIVQDAVKIGQSFGITVGGIVCLKKRAEALGIAASLQSLSSMYCGIYLQKGNGPYRWDAPKLLLCRGAIRYASYDAISSLLVYHAMYVPSSNFGMATIDEKPVILPHKFTEDRLLKLVYERLGKDTLFYDVLLQFIYFTLSALLASDERLLLSRTLLNSWLQSGNLTMLKNRRIGIPQYTKHQVEHKISVRAIRQISSQTIHPSANKTKVRTVDTTKISSPKSPNPTTTHSPISIVQIIEIIQSNVKRKADASAAKDNQTLLKEPIHKEEVGHV